MKPPRPEAYPVRTHNGKPVALCAERKATDMTLFSELTQAPADPILGVTEAFKADERTGKVNLGVGVYLDGEGKLLLLGCVAKAADRIAAIHAPHAYLPIDGLGDYLDQVRELVFCADSPLLADKRVVTVEALGGTGALRLGADMLHEVAPGAKVLVSDPSWENHQALFARAGFEVGTYRYYDATNRGVDVEGMLADLRDAEAGTIVVLHACCHNPTGYDLDHEQWAKVVDIIAERDLVAFCDMAYQGFAEGLAEDAFLVRLCAGKLDNFLVATSFSKSLTLYGQRVGALSVVCADAAEAERLRSRLKIVIRTNYSNPPIFGALVAATVLSDEELRTDWHAELATMRERIKAMRAALLTELQARGIDDMGHVVVQRGMFSYTGLTADQMRALRTDHGVYGTDAGRICIAGLNDTNLAKVADAIAAVRMIR